MTASPTERVTQRLRAHADPAEARKTARRTEPERVIGVRMRTVFEIARTEQDLPVDQVRILLRNHWYEVRLVAVSILDAQARREPPPEVRRGLYETYLAEHAHIDTWDLVDRAAPRVVGGYLLDRSRRPLFELARSASRFERRTSITAAFWLIRAGDLDDPLALVDVLLDDPEEVVRTSVGVALREVGRVDPGLLDDYLANNADRLSASTRRLMRRR